MKITFVSKGNLIPSLNFNKNTRQFKQKIYESVKSKNKAFPMWFGMMKHIE